MHISEGKIDSGFGDGIGDKTVIIFDFFVFIS